MPLTREGGHGPTGWAWAAKPALRGRPGRHGASSDADLAEKVRGSVCGSPLVKKTLLRQGFDAVVDTGNDVWRLATIAGVLPEQGGTTAD